MAVPVNSVEVNKHSSKIKMIMWGIIILIFIIVFCVFGFIIINYNRNISSASLFETAYQKINEFENQTNVYSKQEMEKDIIPILEKVISSYPDTGSAKRAVYYKAYILYSIEKYEESAKLFDHYIKKYTKDDLTDKSYYYLSYCYENLNKIDEAINVLKIFNDKLKTSYYSTFAYYRIGILFEKKGDKKSALEYYEKIININGESSQKENAKKKIELLKNDIKL